MKNVFRKFVLLVRKTAVININCGKCSITAIVHIKASETKLRCKFTKNNIRFTLEAGCYNLICQYIYQLGNIKKRTRPNYSDEFSSI